MSVQVRGQDSASANGTVAQVDSVNSSLRVTQYGPGGNRFLHSCKTGATTAIAALNGTNGIHWACRFTTATTGKLALVERIVAQYTTTVMPSTAQQTGVTLFRATAFTAMPTAGTAQTLTTPNAKLRVSADVPEMLISCEDTTSEMTAGTHTLDSQPLAEETLWALVAGATVQFVHPRLDLDLTSSPLVLANNEGLLIGPSVTQANSLAQVLRVRIQWREVTSYGQ